MFRDWRGEFFKDSDGDDYIPKGFEGDSIKCLTISEANAILAEEIEKLQTVYFIDSVPSPFMHRDAGWPGDTHQTKILPAEILTKEKE